MLFYFHLIAAVTQRLVQLYDNVLTPYTVQFMSLSHCYYKQNLRKASNYSLYAFAGNWASITIAKLNPAPPLAQR